MVMESISASDDVEVATRVSVVVGFVGDIVIESTVGALFDVCWPTEIGLELTQVE